MDSFGLTPGHVTKAMELNIVSTPVERLLQGCDLIKLGMEPNITFGKILELAFEAQLDGEFHTLEEGINWMKKNHESLFIQVIKHIREQDEQKHRTLASKKVY